MSAAAVPVSAELCRRERTTPLPCREFSSDDHALLHSSPEIQEPLIRAKSYKRIESVDPNFVEQVVKRRGIPPDNFVESAEGTLRGLPDLDGDPAARRIIEELERAVGAGNGNGNGNGNG